MARIRTLKLADLPPHYVGAVEGFEMATGRRLEFGEQDECIYTYVIACTGYLKLGRTDNPRRRLMSMQVNCPLELRLIGCVAGDIERQTELLLRSREIRPFRGEWYMDTHRTRTTLEDCGLIEVV